MPLYSYYMGRLQMCESEDLPLINTKFKCCNGDFTMFKMQQRFTYFMFKIWLTICYTCWSVVVCAQIDSIEVFPSVEFFLQHDTTGDNVMPHIEHKLSAEWIDKVSAQNVGEVVRFLPGYTLKDYGGLGGLKTASSRGLSAKYTAVYLNGAPVHNAMAGQIDLSRLLLGGVTSIEVNEGFYSMSNTTAQSFNNSHNLHVNMKLDSMTPGVLHWSLGSFNTRKAQVSTGDLGKKKHHVSIQYQWQNTEGDYPYRVWNGQFYQKETRVHNSLNHHQLYGQYQWEISPKSQLDVLVGYDKSIRQLPGAVILYYQNPGQDLTFNEWNTQFSLTKKNKNGVLKTTTKYNFFNSLYVDENYLSTDNRLLLSNQQNSLYQSVYIDKTIINDWKMYLAGDWQFLNLTNNQLLQNPRRNRIDLVTGTKYEKSKWVAEAKVGGIWTKDNGENAIHYNKFTSGMLLAYRPFKSKQMIIRVTGKSSIRVPDFTELYYNVVNQNLQPEELVEATTGVTFKTPNGRWGELLVTVDAFANQVKNKIVSYPSQNLYFWSFENLASSTGYGIELSALYQQYLGKFIQWKTKLNALDQTIKSDVNALDGESYLPYVPFNVLTAVTSFDYKGVSIESSFIVSGFQYASISNTPESVVPSWQTVDMSIGKEWQKKKFRIKLKIGVKNITDTFFEIIKYYPMPGRQFNFNLSLFT